MTVLSDKWQIVNIYKKLAGLIPDFFKQYNSALRLKISESKGIDLFGLGHVVCVDITKLMKSLSRLR